MPKQRNLDITKKLYNALHLGSILALVLYGIQYIKIISSFHAQFVALRGLMITFNNVVDAFPNLILFPPI